MKKTKYFLFILLAVTCISVSCNRKSVPSGISIKQVPKYDSASFDYYFLEAVKQKLMGNSADALKYLELCIKLNPESDASYYQIGQILFNSGDVKNSKKYLLQAAELSPGNLWYNIMLAGIYYSQKNTDSTIVFYERALKYFPGRENLQMELAAIFLETKKFSEAEEILEALDGKYGANENTTVVLIKNYIAQKKYTEAYDKLKLMIELFPDDITYNALLAEIYRNKGEEAKAADVFKKMMEKHPDDPEAQISLCEFLINQKSYKELLLVLNSVAINDKILREDKLTLFSKILDNNELLKGYGKEIEVILMLLEANYKNDNIVPLLRVDLMEKSGRYNEAADVLESLIKKNQDNYFAWERLLMVYLKKKDYKMLLEKGELCASKFNRSFIAKVLYAQAAIENEKFDLALDELRKANILAGNDAEMQLQVVTMKADAYYKSKNYDKSFETFEEALKLKIDDLTVLNNYAYYLAEQDRNLKEAEKMAESVIEREKNNTTFLDTYAWVLYKRGKLKEAARVMQSIINSDEEPDAEWFEHYGYILKKQRKCKEAVDAWSVSLKLDSLKVHLIKEIENCRK
jgi:tetratricopeptide (TPR) repeat protein